MLTMWRVAKKCPMSVPRMRGQGWADRKTHAQQKSNGNVPNCPCLLTTTDDWGSDEHGWDDDMSDAPETTNTPREQEVHELVRELGIVRGKDLEERGFSRRNLSRLTGKGALERISRGLYGVPDSDVTENQSLAEVRTWHLNGGDQADGRQMDLLDDSHTKWQRRDTA